MPVYWIVDAERRAVQVRTPERLGWHPAGARRAFELELRDLFRPI